MNFKLQIENLKKGSKQKANTVAITASLVITLSVFGIWYLTLGPRLDAIANEGGNKKTENIISGIKDNMANAINGFDSLKKDISSVKEELVSDKSIPVIEVESIK